MSLEVNAEYKDKEITRKSNLNNFKTNVMQKLSRISSDIRNSKFMWNMLWELI